VQCLFTAEEMWVNNFTHEIKNGILDIKVPIIFHSKETESNSITQEDHGNRLLGQHRRDSCRFSLSW
jgi:hypothetical protein